MSPSTVCVDILWSVSIHLQSVCPPTVCVSVSFVIVVSVVLSLDEGDYPENVQIVCLIFYVFGSCFRPLAVILVSDLCE